MTCRIFECARLHGSVQVPPSQEEALWALLLAALGRGPCRVQGLRPPTLGAVECMVEAIGALGAKVFWEGEELRVEPAGQEEGREEDREGTARNAACGIAAPGPLWMLLVPALWVRGREAVLILGEEPEAAVLEALQALPGLPRGPRVALRREPQGEGPGGLRLEVSGKLPAGEYQVEEAFARPLMAGLLMALSHATDREGRPAASRLIFSGPRGEPAGLDRVLAWLGRFGGKYQREDGVLTLLPSQEPSPEAVEVSGDWTLGSALLCANALGGGVRVENLGNSAPGDGLEGPARILTLLGQMGLSFLGSREEWYVTSPSRARLLPLRAHCGDLPDMAPPLALLCTQAWGESVLSGVQGLGEREDRLLEATVAFLTRMGAQAKLSAQGDALVIHGPSALGGGVQVEAAGEPRLALLAALAALVAQGPVTVSGAEVLEEAWPGFLTLYRALGGRVS